MPPGFCDSRSDTPKYAFCPSTAPPHWPPSPLPWPMRYSHTLCPSLSGSSAYAIPDFCGSTRRSRPLTVTRLGEAEKSKSGPSFAGQFALSGIDRSAAERPVVVRRDLIHPLACSAVHVEREHRVGRRLRRIGVVVAGGDVDHVALGIDRGSRPDTAARRAPLLHAVLVLRSRLRLVDRVRLPQHLAGVGVERRNAAAERAALVLRVAALSFFAQPLHADEDLAAVHSGGAGDRRGSMVINFADPDLPCRCSRPRRRRSRASRRSRPRSQMRPRLCKVRPTAPS